MIEIKDLMIGDLVYNKHHEKPIKITQYDFFTHGHRENGEQYLNANPIPTLGRDLEPIPLTPEILENNGFVKYGGKYNNLQQWILRKPVIFTLHQDTFHEIWCIRNIWIKYVHELQHALKLCGIDKEIVL